MDEDSDKYYDICPNCNKEIKIFIERPLEFQAKMQGEKSLAFLLHDFGKTFRSILILRIAILLHDFAL